MTTHNVPARRLSVLLTLALLVTQLSAQSSTPEFPNPGKPRSMSRDEQRQLGLQTAAQVYKLMPVLPDNSPETQYIRQLGQKLVATIPSQYSWPFEFHVIPQKDINAFALPGGPMFVNIGTITAAGNEAELAGVMAHEISHVYMQHSAKQYDKAQVTGLLAGLASTVAGAALGGAGGQLAQMGIKAGAQGFSLKYSRSDESQADAVGAIILYQAGYNPQALADFFKTLQSEGGQVPPEILSDHPNPGNREQAIEKEIRNWPPKNYQTTSAAFEKTKQHAMTVKAYTGEEIAAGAKSGEWAALNKKNGATFNPNGASAVSTSAPTPTSPAGPSRNATVSLESVLPSPRTVAANLGSIKLTRPDNWQVTTPRQRGDYVTIAPQAGLTPDGVAYGVMINSAGLPAGERMNLDQATAQLLQDLEQNNGVKSAGNPKPITVSGVQGRSVMMQSASPIPNENGQQQLERDWLVAVPKSGDTLIYFVFIAPQSQFERFRPTFESMLKSVKFRTVKP